jgi:hypothetical protein
LLSTYGVNALCRCVRLWSFFVFSLGGYKLGGVWCGCSLLVGCAWVGSGVATGAESRV